MQRELVFPSPTMEFRYWSHVDVRGPDECWPWKGCASKGYGKIWVGDDADGVVIMRRSHRVGWALANGKDPGRQHVRHRCDNPPCQNPSHLELGSHEDNMRDMAERGRAVRLRGEEIGNSKLTTEAVKEIRALYDSGYTQRTIADRFNVTSAAISKAVRQETWASVESPVPQDRWMNKLHAAKHVGIDRATLDRYVAAGHVEVRQDRGKYRVDVDQLEAFVKQRRRR